MRLASPYMARLGEPQFPGAGSHRGGLVYTKDPPQEVLQFVMAAGQMESK